VDRVFAFWYDVGDAKIDRADVRALTHKAIVNRTDGMHVELPVVAGRWMRILYETLPGRAALWLLIRRKWVSRLYGVYAKTRRSRRAAQKIIETYALDMSRFGPFDTYEAFFTRSLGAIEMPGGLALGSMAECFISAYEGIDIDALLDVKGEGLRLDEILGSAEPANRYRGGTLLRFRLAPHHYHHLHHFDDGVIASVVDIPGAYYSVNPIALLRIARVYARNRRRVVMINTRRFGTATLVEIGATMVGSIVNPFRTGDRVRTGEDGGHFAPGGSMLLLLFEKGRVNIAEDLLENTRNGFETLVSLAEIIGEGVA
jgi:phosphatidylserine decarboxylase